MEDRTMLLIAYSVGAIWATLGPFILKRGKDKFAWRHLATSILAVAVGVAASPYILPDAIEPGALTALIVPAYLSGFALKRKIRDIEKRWGHAPK